MLLLLHRCGGKDKVLSLHGQLFFPSTSRNLKKKFTKQLAILSFEVLKVRYFTTLEFGDKKDENCHQNEQVE